MVQVLEAETAPASIEATLNYIADTGTKIFTQTGGPGSTDVRSGGTQDPRRVVIRNGRLQAQDFALERHGFRFVSHDTKVGNFFDEAEVKRVYYPEMEALVKAESGASRVVVFDHTLRTADDALREAKKIREVVPRVHNDYTEWSGPQRVRDLVPDEAGDLLRTLALARGSGDLRAHLSQPRRPDLRHHLQSRARVVLVPAHAARGGAGVQGVRFGDGRPRPLDGAYGVRGPHRAAPCPAAREHRDPHAGVFLSRHDDPFYLILCRPAPQALEAGAAFLRLQPALARRGGWARLAAHAGSDAGAADELDQARERVLPVARLGAVTLRIDDEHAL